MGEMISMIAHQWRQPLGAISATVLGIETKIIFKKYDLSKEEDREQFLEFLKIKLKNISEYVQGLSTTIDDFRNFFKPDKAKERLSLTSSIKRALGIVEVSMSNKNIEILTTFDDNEEIELYHNEIMQVILNILKNAEDNFKEKGDIKDAAVWIRTYKKDNRHAISIKDNGGGIPDDIMPKIFDPYFSTKNEKNGTGLGLYMSKVIVEEHNGGKLEARNIENGVEFILSFEIE
jgi:signal transduction histidine kinase